MTKPELSSRRLVRRLFGVVALSFSLFGAAAAISSPIVEAAIPDVGKIAVVDMQRILNETAAGQKARKDLETSSLSKQKKLDKLQKKLEDDQKAMTQIKDQQAYAQAAEKLQRDYYEFQTMYMTLQQELAEQEARTLARRSCPWPSWCRR